ncbi:Thyroid hormone-inducible hepatic protein [Tupaia chinensis]|uniref:Thyroid hormone-inducible hepatic protein n=1 Tax=Tupaia chinensis TaxID=246437 RepID=L9JIG8_TUPCH|nr:Thyroid hormone-inducible hepatic protein [Tupaia chinensis]
MDCCSATMHNMERVCVGGDLSLLWGLQLAGPGSKAQSGSSDLRTYFTMLKTIHTDVGHGWLLWEEWLRHILIRLTLKAQEGPGNARN